jgi:hypothetical protein
MDRHVAAGPARKGGIKQKLAAQSMLPPGINTEGVVATIRRRPLPMTSMTKSRQPTASPSTS